jgi:PAS domain S-box-containing protein
MPPAKKSRRPRPRRTTRTELETDLKFARSQLADRRGEFRAEAIRRLGREAESSREHYAELYDYAPFGHLTLDANGVIRTLNLTAAALLERPRAHLIGRPFVVLVAQPDRRRFLNHLSRLRHGEPHASTELELKPLNGRPVQVQIVSVVRRKAKAHGHEYHTALVDITERKRAEARTAAMARLGLQLSAASDPAAAARAIVETAQELCGWDACFLFLHDAATDHVTHLVNLDTINGQRVPVPPILQGRPPTPLIRRVLEEGPQLILRKSPEEPGPLTVRFGDASRPSLSLMFVPVRQENRNIGVLSIQSYGRNAYTPESLGTLQALADHVAGALGRLQAQAALLGANEELEAANERLRKEIETRQLAETALLRTADELRRSNAELEEFAYVASHDLQEPLRAVGGYVRLLEHRFPDKLDAKVREYIEGAVEGANRMEQQLSDLLALSRVGSGGLKPEWTDLGVPLKTALHYLLFTIRSSEAKVTSDPMPTLPVDAGQMVQLFQNLIANALKFRGDAPPEIHVGAREEETGWVIWVQDNGIGIAPQYFTRIFQVFQRLHTRKRHAGTGIGLAICKKIVERHGGRIWVASEPGKGATFYFSIPAKAQTSTDGHR